jgi:hypothetical protein
MCTCVRDIEATATVAAKKLQNQNAERNFTNKISLKNYKCRSRQHILQQQQKYVHTKILFSVYIRRVKINFFLLLLMLMLLHRCSFMAKFYTREWILYFRLPALLLKVKTDFPLPKMKMKICAACAKMCAFVHSHVFWFCYWMWGKNSTKKDERKGNLVENVQNVMLWTSVL